MRDNNSIHPVLFLDDWPAPPNCSGGGCELADQDHIAPGMNNMRRWRIQTLLAVNPWGIPLMAFKEAYERMFRGKTFESKDHGYENISAMVYDLPDIFAVQEADDVTALMFPDYPHDRILHDARLGHDFSPQSLAMSHESSAEAEFLEADETGRLARGAVSELDSLINGQQQIARRWSSSNIVDETSASTISGSSTNKASILMDKNGSPCGSFHGKTIDPDILISYAWIHRDTDFPPDTVLAGEQYNELILPLTSAHIPGTRGVHQAIIVGVANPGSFYINVKSSDSERYENLTREIYQYFMQCGANIDQYNVPEEFLYPGFPCLVYSIEHKCWERCVVVSRSRRTNRVLVECVDLGGTITVNRIYLYLMPRKFLDLPKQALLCSLIGVRPKEDDKWSRTISCRMRFFSQPRYWHDVLLVEPKAQPVNSAINMSIPSPIGDKSASPAAVTSDSSVDSAKPASSSLLTSSDAATIDSQTSGGEQSEQTSQEQQPAQEKRKRKKRLLEKKLDFETIICDRHDDYGSLDIFLNDILVMETYGSLDTDRAEEYNSLKESFKKALATLPRPRNPFKTDNVERFWPKRSDKCDADSKAEVVKSTDDKDEA